MTDICSRLSYEELKKSGKLGKNQALYLMVFMRAYQLLGSGLTHYEATQAVFNQFQIHMPARNGRIAELTRLGFLKKHTVKYCEKTKRLVNTWIWTKRTTPYEWREEWQACEHCNGKGGSLKRVFEAPPLTSPGDLFRG